ncbi:phosphatidylinositol N-acetylglucosaminyltransferase subunit C isoform X1 [Cimex lectularius]|uniref:Phosphatidylinositol N-acetylglucosaminyltransferase subunit C n=2 Tax=Cimex lectularius TaxID=79782 RepID=A0A8I6R7B3_CIMLE|nr:phosphatidylinositol N-acetylglucosaminyltransferase subunit C isoform X1 [Cimex lectularius]
MRSLDIGVSPNSECRKSKMITGRKPWRKNLWENQGYPDNYTDASFLEELKKNINVREVTFKEAFLGSSLITQQLCIIVFFSLNFYYMHNNLISSEVLFVCLCITATIGYIFYVIVDALANVPLFSCAMAWKAMMSSIQKLDKKRHLKAIVYFLLLGFVLSPVLKTLTESVSTDTIYAMTVFIMGIHMVFFDYGLRAVIVSSSLSLNAAVFASVCLASRLATPFDTFVLLTCSILHFLLCPLLLSKLSNYPLMILIIMATLSLYGLYQVDKVLTSIFFCSVIFINFICPYLFVRWHAYKDNIYGPWDEAVVEDLG